MMDTSNRIDAARLLPVAIGVALASALLAGLALIFVGKTAGDRARFRESFATLSALSQNIPLQAGAAVRGSAPAFDALADSRSRLEQTLKSSGGQGGLLGPDDRFGDQAGWTALLEQSQAVLDGRDAAIKAQQAAANVRETTPQLLAALTAVVDGVGPARAENLNRHAERFEVRARAVEQDLAALADGTSPVEAASRRLADGLDYMGQVVAGLSGDRNALVIDAVVPAGAAQVLATTFAAERDQVRGAIALGDQLEQIQAARNALAETGTSLYANLAKAERSAGGGVAGRFANPWIPLALLGITLAALLAALYLHRSLASLRREADSQTRQNERNQQAILRLLDELSSLADGDLTVQATVTEDITGAIADSINYAIEALRELVTTIHDSAIKLDGATRQTQALSTHLAKASSAQSKQIAAASESITAMAASTEEVSGNAERSSDVARHSVDIAAKGGDAVRRTIDGMNAIRENIQETSKRIKRLGESSQEIGNIVELINDIAEQTNILALNASIQASMAGEAGRGFAVVADEVQRLAERAGQRDEADRSARAHDPGRHQRGRRVDGAHDHGRGRWRVARRERGCGARGDREGLEPDRESRAEHLRKLAPAGGHVAEHLAQHAGAARDQLADRREHDGDLRRRSASSRSSRRSCASRWRASACRRARSMRWPVPPAATTPRCGRIRRRPVIRPICDG
jgi:twitching motility protein PilJ